MLKNKIDEYVECLSFTLAMSEDEIRVLRAAFEDIVKATVEVIKINKIKTSGCIRGDFLKSEWIHGYNECAKDQKAKAEEILNQLK